MQILLCWLGTRHKSKKTAYGVIVLIIRLINEPKKMSGKPHHSRHCDEGNNHWQHPPLFLYKRSPLLHILVNASRFTYQPKQFPNVI